MSSVFVAHNKEVIRRKVNALNKGTSAEKNIDFRFGKEVCDYIAAKCEGTKTGARELRNIIRREIEDKIVDMIIENEGGFSDAKVSVKKNELIIATI